MRKLYDLDPNEVSLVPRGANKKRFLVFKSQEGAKMTNKDIREMIENVDPKVMEKVSKSIGMMKKIGKDAGDMPPKADSHVFKDTHNVEHDGESDRGPLSDRAQAALKAVARILAPFKDEIGDEHLDEVQHEIGMHMDPGKEAGEGHKKIEMSMEAIPEKVEEEHHSAALDMAKKAYMGHLEKMGYRKYPDEQIAQKAKKPEHDEDEEEDEDEIEKNKIEKGLDLSAFTKEQRPQIEAIFKAYGNEKKELVEKAAKLEKELATRDAKEKEREYIAKAESFTHIALPKAEIIETLKDAAKLGTKSFERICKQYDALNEQAKKSNLFGEIGFRGGSTEGDAHAKLEALVDSVVMKSDGRSREEIYETVLKTAEGKRLYNEGQKTRPGGI